MSFVRINPGDLIQAVNVNQIIDALTGAVGKGVAMAMTALNDQTNYALTVQNQDATNSRALLVLNSAGTMMERIDATGISFGTPLNLANNSVQGAALVDAGVPNAKLGPDVARANLLVNGGFEQWQRGNGPFTNVSSTYGPDRWGIGAAGTDTLSISRNTANVDGSSLSCAACTLTLGTGAGGSNISQMFRQADGQAIAGVTVTASVRVQTSVANAVRIGIYNGTAWTYSGFHSGNGAYQTLSVTATPGFIATPMQLSVFFAASGTHYVDNANLVVGSQPANYVPLHPADDLARCLRYYQRWDLAKGGSGTPWVSVGMSGSTTQHYLLLTYQAQSAVTPTLTTAATLQLTNGSANANVAGASLAGSGVNSATLSIQTTAFNSTGMPVALQLASGGYLAVEANP